MTVESEVEKLKEQVDKVKERLGTLQNLALVLGSLAVVLGFGGARLSDELRELKITAATLETRVATYRTEAEEARDNLTKTVKSIVEAEAAKARGVVEKAENAALGSLQEQQKTSLALLQKQISVSEGCGNISTLQLCWGTAVISRDPQMPHTAAFSFRFEKPFARTPAVVNGINVKGMGHALGVYSWEATPSEYNGRLNNMYLSQPISGIVTMQYVAVGTSK